jgi:hypothetical protein
VQPLLQWKRNLYYTAWVRVCSLSYPACIANAPYCHLCPDRLYRIFPRNLTDEIIFGKILLNIKRVFSFSVQLLSKTFLVLRIIQRDIIINVHRSLYKVPIVVFVVRFKWKFNFLFRFSEKYSNIKFHKNPSSRSPISCMGMDRRTNEHTLQS